MKSNFQKSNGLGALLKSTLQQFFFKMGSEPSKHVFSVIDLTSMGTINYKNFDLSNVYLERTRRPGKLVSP
jgi:hypothetical protein